MSKTRKTIIAVQGIEIAVVSHPQGDYISLTDMLKAKDGDFFISDWLRNRNTAKFLGIWESVYNPESNYGEFATIRGQALAPKARLYLSLGRCPRKKTPIRAESPSH